MEYAVNIQAVYEKYNPKKLQDAGEKSDVADVGQLFRFVVFLFLSTACAIFGFRIWPMLLCWACLLLFPFWTPVRQQPGKLKSVLLDSLLVSTSLPGATCCRAFVSKVRTETVHGVL